MLKPFYPADGASSKCYRYKEQSCRFGTQEHLRCISTGFRNDLPPVPHSLLRLWAPAGNTLAARTTKSQKRLGRLVGFVPAAPKCNLQVI